MANINIALKKTLQYEGGYVNDPSDSGGETICGISRNNFPKWDGWSLVDSTPQKNSLLKSNDFMIKVSEFYKSNFWDALSLDSVNSQDIANNMFDFAVNSGTDRAARYMQRLLGLTEDGKIGPVSIKTINAQDPAQLLAKYKGARKQFLNKIVKNNPSQAKFLAGWVKRTETA